MTTEIINATQTVELTAANITSAAKGAMVTSLVAAEGDRAASAKIYNAMNNPTGKVSEHINETVEIRDYLIEQCEIEEVDSYGIGTGKWSVVPRTVLITAEGEAYQATSFGIANAVRNLVAACGNAPWEPSLQLKVKQVPTKAGSMLTLEMLG